eukprot:g21328.t1
MVFSSSGKLFAAADRAGDSASVDALGGSSSKPSVESNGSFHVHGEVLALAFSMEKGLAVATSDKVVLLAVPVLQDDEWSWSEVEVGSYLLAEEGDLSAGVVFWEVSGAFKRLGSMIFQQMIRVTTFRPDGRYLAVAGDNKLISLVDVLNDFDHEGDLPCSHTVRALAWSPNLRCLASGGEDHLVTVWDLASKHILFQMEPMKGREPAASCRGSRESQQRGGTRRESYAKGWQTRPCAVGEAPYQKARYSAGAWGHQSLQEDAEHPGRQASGPFGSHVDGSILVAWVGNLATKLALAATNCALSLNVDAVCAAGVTGLVSAFGELSAGAALGSATCRTTPVPLSTTEISQLGDTSLKGRRLLIGQGEVGNGVQCAVDVGMVAANLANLGMAINKAVNVHDCKKSTFKRPLNVLKGIPEAWCTVDIGGAVAYISQALSACAKSVVTFINFIVVHCEDFLDINALCAGSIAAITTGAAAVAPDETGKPRTKRQELQKIEEMWVLPTAALPRRLAETPPLAESLATLARTRTAARAMGLNVSGDMAQTDAETLLNLMNSMVVVELVGGEGPKTKRSSAREDWIVRLAWSSHGLLAYTHAGAQGVRLAPLEEEMPMERSQELEDAGGFLVQLQLVREPGGKEEPEVPAFVFSVRLPSSTGAPVAKEPSSEEGFRLHVAKDRVDVPASSMKLDMSHPGLVFAQQDWGSSLVSAGSGRVRWRRELAQATREPNFVMGHHLTACSFMPHGLSLMVAGEEVFEWEVEGKTKLREIHLRDAANVLATSPCGGYVAVANATTVTVHRLMSKGQEAVLNRKVTSNIVALAFSSRHFLAVGTIEKKVLVFHLEDSKDRQGGGEPEVLVAQVNDLCFAPSGDILAIPGGDDEVGQVLLWRVEREACMYLGTVATRGVALCARFDETGDILAVGCDDDRIVLLLPEHSFKCWTELRSSFSVARLAFAGNFLCAAGDREAAIFNLSNSQLVLQVPRQEEKIKDISLTGDGCLACCFRGHVTLLRLENAPQVPSGRAVMQVPSDKDRFKSRGTVTEVMHSVQLNFGHVEAAQEGLQVSRSMRSTGSCSNLELGGEDSSARLEARRSLSKSKSLPSDTKVGEGSVDESAYIPIHPGEGDLLQQPPWLLKPRISVTDTSQGGGSRCTTPGEKDEDPEAAALRKRMLLARDLGLDPAIQSKIQITKRPEGVPIKLKHADEVCSLSFFGSSLVAGGYDQHLALWDVEGLTRATDVHLESEIVCVSFSPCGEYVYCGDADRQLNVFKAKTLELLGSEVIKEQFGCLAGISTPTTLLAVGSTAVVKIFTVPRLEEVASLQHGGQVHSLSFAPSLGMLAAAGGMDLTDGLLDYSAKENRNMKAMVWKSTELAGLWDEFEKVEELLCGAGIRTLAWTRNSRLLASAGEDMRVSVWDVLFKRVVLHLPKARGRLCGLAFSMDSRWLATCGYGQEAVDLWPIEVEDCEFSW